MSVGSVNGAAVSTYLVAAISRQANSVFQQGASTPSSSQTGADARHRVPSDFMAAVIARQVSQMSDADLVASATTSQVSDSAKNALSRYTEFAID
jgi:hypothetical protein